MTSRICAGLSRHAVNYWNKPEPQGYLLFTPAKAIAWIWRTVPRRKKTRGGKTFIGESGPMGRILIRGEQGHDIIPELAPLPGEPIIDKPGKGAFYATDLGLILQTRGIKSLIICGVTTEVCVQTTAREANDRGYELVIPEDCCASYFPEFHRAALDMMKAQGAIVGWVSDSASITGALQN